MTAALVPARLTATPTGWGLTADLIPPEVVATRRLRQLRRRIAVALALLVALVALAYGVAETGHAAAADRAAAVQAQTAPILAEQRRYTDVTSTQAELTRTRALTARLMAGDVDVSALLAHLDAPLPPTMTITSLSVNLVQSTLAGLSGGGQTGGAAGLDTSGRTPVGSVVVGGTARAFDDVARYAEALASIPGIANVVPTSSQADEDGVKYSLTCTLTDPLLSGRFDLRTAATP